MISKQASETLSLIKSAHRAGGIPIDSPYMACDLRTGHTLEKRETFRDDQSEGMTAQKPQKFSARFTRLDPATRTATFNVPSRHTKHGRVGGRAIMGQDDLPSGRVTNVWRATAGSADIDCQLNDDAWNKASAGVLAGVTVETDSGGNSHVKLVDQLNDIGANLPKWAKLQKGDGADFIKSAHATGGHQLAPEKLGKAGSLFDTRATADSGQLRKVASQRQWLSDQILKSSTDTLEVLRVLHMQRPQKVRI